MYIGTGRINFCRQYSVNTDLIRSKKVNSAIVNIHFAARSRLVLVGISLIHFVFNLFKYCQSSADNHQKMLPVFNLLKQEIFCQRMSFFFKEEKNVAKRKLTVVLKDHIDYHL